MIVIIIPYLKKINLTAKATENFSVAFAVKHYFSYPR